MPFFSVPQLVELGIILSSLHWLLARSRIMEPFWSRTTGWVARLLVCPACSGFWLGLAVPPLNGNGWEWRARLIQGFLGIWLTPIFEAALLWGLALSAIELDEEPQPTEGSPGSSGPSA